MARHGMGYMARSDWRFVWRVEVGAERPRHTNWKSATDSLSRVYQPTLFRQDSWRAQINACVSSESESNDRLAASLGKLLFVLGAAVQQGMAFIAAAGRSPGRQQHPAALETTFKVW